MLSRLAAGVSAALLLLTPALVSASTTSSTPRPLIPGSQPLLLAHALGLGPAPTTARQTVVLALKLRDEAGLDRLLTA